MNCDCLCNTFTVLAIDRIILECPTCLRLWGKDDSCFASIKWIDSDSLSFFCNSSLHHISNHTPEERTSPLSFQTPCIRSSQVQPSSADDTNDDDESRQAPYLSPAAQNDEDPLVASPHGDDRDYCYHGDCCFELHGTTNDNSEPEKGNDKDDANPICTAYHHTPHPLQQQREQQEESNGAHLVAVHGLDATHLVC